MAAVIKENPATLQKVAEEAALKSGKLVRQLWDNPRQVSNKGYRDIVTDADLASQNMIVDFISSKFPEHGFLTEEDDPALRREGKVMWIIDPVDGTTNYSRQIPIYCVSIAAVQVEEASSTKRSILDPTTKYKILAGVIYDPARDELFSAADGQGSSLNGAPIHVSTNSTLDLAVVSIDLSRRFEKRQAMLDAINRIAHKVHNLRATGSAALALAWVAAGRLDIYYNFGIGPWDVAAAHVIIYEAGGQISNLYSRPWRLGDKGCLASNQLLHDSFYTLAEYEG